MLTTDARDRTELQIAAHEAADFLVAQGSPLVDPRQVFDRFVKVNVRASTQKAALKAKEKSEKAVKDAIGIMLATIPGDMFIRELAKLRKVKRAWITAEFRDRAEFPPDEDGVPHESSGYYMPNDFEEANFKVFVDYAENMTSGQISLGQSTELTGTRVYFFGTNEMADTLFHELLHVWFIVKHRTNDFAHHGDFVDERFMTRLQQFRRDLLASDKSRRPRP